MGDLSTDTRIEPCGPGRYSATLSRDWEIWGPMGGYVAAFAMRSAGASSPFRRPASFFCHYLGVAAFDRDLRRRPVARACRSLILADVQSWPANSQHHAWKEPHGFIAPSLDLYVAFHCPAPAEQWLLADGYAPVSRGGMFGWTGRIWTTSGTLVASGGGQALYRRVPVPESAHTEREAHG